MKKTALITGGTSGIGKATAMGLAKAGFHVFITGRNRERAELAVQEVKSRSGNNQVDFFISDMSEIPTVRNLAIEIRNKLDRLDVLVNNAGAVYQKREFNSQGIEKTFATNHLAYFVLTNELLELLKGTAPSRIINVSSKGHYAGRVDLRNLQGEKNYYILKAYNNSKLCNVLFTYELARRLNGTGVTANCLHPGLVGTAIGNKNTNGFSSAVWTMVTRLRGISVEKGAETSLYLALAPEVGNVTGKYFDKSREKMSLKVSYDLELARQLWDESERLTSQ